MTAISSEVTQGLHNHAEQLGYDAIFVNFLVILTWPPIWNLQVGLVLAGLVIPDFRNLELNVCRET